MMKQRIDKKLYKVLCVCIALLVVCHSAMAQEGNEIRAALKSFNTFVARGETAKGVESAVQAAVLYYTANNYQQAFDLLRDVEQTISANRNLDDKEKATLRYKVVKERLQMYMRMHRTDRAKEQLATMERYAQVSCDEEVENDLLYNQAICYYSFGMTAKADVVFKMMAERLTASGDYDKVDDVYQTLIANGRRSGSAGMVAQAYSGYIAWKDSMTVLKHAAEVKALKQQIAETEELLAEKDENLSSRQHVIVGLGILAAVLAGVLALGSLLLLRLIVVNRRQKITIRRANENIALKAKFISNISAQIRPSLQKLNAQQPEVKALQDFSEHVQTLSQLETAPQVELEDTPLYPFCEALANEIKGQVKEGVIVYVDVPRMNALINKEYLGHVLRHLLSNAVAFTPEGGHIRLSFKKRGAHKHQFLVSNTGSTIPDEKREDVFKPFLEVHDLTQGDGLGLPICRAMAEKMNGELEIDPEFTKGTRFVLTLGV